MVDQISTNSKTINYDDITSDELRKMINSSLEFEIETNETEIIPGVTIIVKDYGYSDGINLIMDILSSNN
jgi:hypothetical protein